MGMFAPPTKRSVTIAGHQTSISLEPMFWTALENVARDDGVALSRIVARIDAERIAGGGAACNLTSAIRQWLWQRVADRGSKGD